jgi:hypothetical protein
MTEPKVYVVTLNTPHGQAVLEVPRDERAQRAH